MTFEVVKKARYWEALNDSAVFRSLGGFTLKALDGLKHIQDAVTLRHLLPVRNNRILEIGGGASRVLPALHSSNERWNLDPFEGAGNGRTTVHEIPGVRLVSGLMGDNDPQVPDGYFDILFSISVIEHITAVHLGKFWTDHARVMKPGGSAFHAIDFYASETGNKNDETRLDFYLNGPIANGLRFKTPPSLHRPLTFRCDMASNSDWGMWRWNQNVPSLAEKRATHQSVTLWMELEKPQ
ncbi:MAG: hypothetical protein A3E78_09365 [Alphaproteobacteria bacterium RIFCSPHIGHO2_12_FULL_63_12]|nr:MAG: hypothetical protein A3E78_09365 [Alphaproteobacteria bacterium RIFCSPHIGHO2_12_FULL_63_12]